MEEVVVMSQGKVADRVEILDGRLLIDGEEFPWHVSPEVGYQASVRRGEISSVTITILARHVTIDA